MYYEEDQETRNTLVFMRSEVAQSCLTLCDPMDCSLPGSSVHGIFQARVLGWVAISFSPYILLLKATKFDFIPWLLQKILLRTWCAFIFLNQCFHFLHIYNLAVELLDHMSFTFSFQINLIQFPQWLQQCTFPPAGQQGSLFPHDHQHLLLLNFKESHFDLHFSDD